MISSPGHRLLADVVGSGKKHTRKESLAPSPKPQAMFTIPPDAEPVSEPPTIASSRLSDFRDFLSFPNITLMSFLFFLVLWFQTPPLPCGATGAYQVTLVNPLIAPSFLQEVSQTALKCSRDASIGASVDVFEHSTFSALLAQHGCLATSEDFETFLKDLLQCPHSEIDTVSSGSTVMESVLNATIYHHLFRESLLRDPPMASIKARFDLLTYLRRIRGSETLVMEQIAELSAAIAKMSTEEQIDHLVALRSFTLGLIDTATMSWPSKQISSSLPQLVVNQTLILGGAYKALGEIDKSFELMSETIIRFQSLSLPLRPMYLDLLGLRNDTLPTLLKFLAIDAEIVAVVQRDNLVHLVQNMTSNTSISIVE